MPECFLCAKVIEGDADFFQFHLNACLDSPSAPSPPAPSASLDYLAAIYNDDDEVESSIALARQLSQEEQARFPDAHDGCPLCGHTWNELSLSNDAEKESHADGCAYVPQTQSQEYQSRDETEDSSDEEPIASGSTGSTGFVLGRGGEKDAVIGTTSNSQIILSPSQSRLTSTRWQTSFRYSTQCSFVLTTRAKLEPSISATKKLNTSRRSFPTWAGVAGQSGHSHSLHAFADLTL